MRPPASLRRHLQMRARGRMLATTAQSGLSLPERARVVVVGGGVIGTSVAYHLAHKLNPVGSSGPENRNASATTASHPDVLLLEQAKITAGTTWHAAGLCVTFGSLSETHTRIRQYTRDLYANVLERETGMSTGFKGCGFIELATNPDRLIEFRRSAAFNRHMGVDVREITPSEVQDLFPLCRVDDVLAGFYVPDDGRVNPVDVTMAMAKGARQRGAKIIEGVSVAGVTTDKGRVTGVRTDHGEVVADVVVNCAGMWARQFGEMAGVSIPNQAAEHYYLITDKMQDVDPNWPVIEDPASHVYIRPEAGGLLVGLFEPKAAAWNVNKIPDAFAFGEIDPDWDRMAPFLDRAMNRAPRTLEVGAKKFFCGPESFTPDLAPIVGEAPELRNYFVAAGMNSVGILSGGGMGRLLAHWILNGKPDMDVTGMNIDRFHRYMANPEFRSQRVVESLGLVYKCHYPAYGMKTARNAKKSPIYDRLKARNAYFKEVSGYEGADWYAPPGVEAKVEPLTFGKHHWFPYWKAEHDAARNGVVLMDMSFMSKFFVQGRDAGAFLNRLSTANVDGDQNMITYTQWLDDGGKMQADLTVTKTASDKFFVVATDTMHRHVETWMQRHVDDDFVTVTDVTGAYAQLNIQGPHSRSLLQALTDTDVSNKAYPFRTAREIAIGLARLTCVRITYLGELGYELYVPSEFALHVYDRIVEVGESFGLVHAGLKALGSLRMEKGYRDYGHDMDNTDSLLEVGLGFTCDFDKPYGFIGREAVLEQKSRKLANLPQRLLQVLVKDPEPMMYHGEVVWRNGVRVGDVRAASYGHTLGGAVGLAMVKGPADGTFGSKYLEEGKWEVEVADRRYPALVSLRPFYDPENSRIKM